MARDDCMLERNVRIFRAYKHGVSQKALAKMTGVSPERIRQIIHSVEHYINNGEPDYIYAYNNLGD